MWANIRFSHRGLRTKSDKDISFEATTATTTEEKKLTGKFRGLLKRAKSSKEPEKTESEKKQIEIEEAMLRVTPETKVFGVPLAEVISKQRHVEGIPRPIYDCITFLNERALDEEGLYRIPGSKLSIELFKAKYDCGDDVIFDVYEDPTTMVSLILAYIREAPESIFSRTGLEILQSLRGTDESEMNKKLKEGLSNFPPEYMKVVGEIIWHLNAVSCHKHNNKMSAANLAMCIYPTLAGPVRGMIQHCATIFPPPVIKSSIVQLEDDGTPVNKFTRRFTRRSQKHIDVHKSIAESSPQQQQQQPQQQKSHSSGAENSEVIKENEPMASSDQTTEKTKNEQIENKPSSSKSLDAGRLTFMQKMFQKGKK